MRLSVQDWGRQRLGWSRWSREGLWNRCVKKGTVVVVYGYIGTSSSSGERGARAFIRCRGKGRRKKCSCSEVILCVVEIGTSSRDEGVRHVRGGSDLEGSQCGRCLLAIGLVTLLGGGWPGRAETWLKDLTTEWVRPWLHLHLI